MGDIVRADPGQLEQELEGLENFKMSLFGKADHEINPYVNTPFDRGLDRFLHPPKMDLFFDPLENCWGPAFRRVS